MVIALAANFPVIMQNIICEMPREQAGLRSHLRGVLDSDHISEVCSWPHGHLAKSSGHAPTAQHRAQPKEQELMGRLPNILKILWERERR